MAGIGALHGLNPAGGWPLVALRGEGVRAWRALAPVALGHAASVAAIAALAALGLVAQRGVLPWLAGGLAVFVAAAHVSGQLPQCLHAAAGRAGLALWSFAMGVLHGASMMLVPALMPLCLSGSPAREITASGSIALALAAVALHMAAMLTATAAMAALASRGGHLYHRRAHRAAGRANPRGALHADGQASGLVAGRGRARRGGGRR